MSTSIEADVKLIMTAEDRMSQPVQDAVSRVNLQYRQMRNTQKSIGRGFELEHQGFSNTIRGLTAIGRVAHTATSIFQRYNIMQLRMAEGARSLKKAQSDLAESIAKYGANSKEAAAAASDLNMEHQKSAALRREDILNNFGLGLSALTTVGTLNRNGALGRGLSRMGGIFGGGGNPALTGALAGLSAGAPSLLSRALPIAGPAAGIAAGGLLGSSLHEKLPSFGYGKEIEGFLNERVGAPIANALGMGGGQKIQNININTNEIGVTSDEVINGADLFG